MSPVVNWSAVFPGRAESLADARRFTHAILGDIDGAHTAAYVVSELAGNAIKHSASGETGGLFVLHLSTFEDRCRVRVDDQGGPKAPSVCESGEEAEQGRGLNIVAALSKSWGFDGGEDARSVWAEVVFDEVSSDGRS